MEIVAFLYIILGLTVISVAHISKYGNKYVERVPVILRMNSIKRWIQGVLDQEKI